jgi:D-glycero-D-manno-heptose 1,7-bisphosphate phosphatase
LLLQAAEKYRIDLSQSIMLGDSEADMLAGRAAGCRSVMIGAFEPDMLV